MAWLQTVIASSKRPASARRSTTVSEDWIALVVVVATFGCGILGLFLQRWPRERHMSGDTRDLINRVTGLAGTMTALVLGLLIASANSFYNNQKSSLEETAAKLLQLDDVLRRYGPEAEPVREQLKASAIKTYDEDWGSGSETLPTIAESSAAIDALPRLR
jgi:ABC-type transporter Mla subunit MlaD